MGHAVSASYAPVRRPSTVTSPTEVEVETDFTLRDVALGYGDKVVVRGVTGEFARGSLTAIVGPNGGGKTTLVKALLGQLTPMRGTIEARHPRRAVGYLAQRDELDLGFPVRVEDFVSVGLWADIGTSRVVGPALGRRVEHALGCVGLHDFGRRWMDELSGGQLQRMRFARLLAQDAPVVVLDEPFTGVDAPTVDALLRVIADWHAQGRTVVAVLHDLHLVQAHFPRTLALDGSSLAWSGTADALAALSDARKGRDG